MTDSDKATHGGQRRVSKLETMLLELLNDDKRHQPSALPESLMHMVGVANHSIGLLNGDFRTEFNSTQVASLMYAFWKHQDAKTGKLNNYIFGDDGSLQSVLQDHPDFPKKKPLMLIHVGSLAGACRVPETPVIGGKQRCACGSTVSPVMGGESEAPDAEKAEIEQTQEKRFGTSPKTADTRAYSLYKALADAVGEDAGKAIYDWYVTEEVSGGMVGGEFAQYMFDALDRFAKRIYKAEEAHAAQSARIAACVVPLGKTIGHIVDRNFADDISNEESQEMIHKAIAKCVFGIVFDPASLAMDDLIVKLEESEGGKGE